MTMPSDEERFLYGKAEKHKKKKTFSKNEQVEKRSERKFYFWIT